MRYMRYMRYICAMRYTTVTPRSGRRRGGVEPRRRAQVNRWLQGLLTRCRLLDRPPIARAANEGGLLATRGVYWPF